MKALSGASDPCTTAPRSFRTGAPGTQVNFFARPSPTTEPFPPPRLVAWLNHTNRIISLPAAWEPFAAIIGVAGLPREQVLGRPVAWFIGDATIREYFRVLLTRIRLEGRQARMLARCDAPGQPRAMQLRLSPLSAGAVECTWTFLHGAAAAEVNEGRSGGAGVEYIRMCSWCRRVHPGRRWERLEEAAPALGILDHAPLPPITHGICPHCSAAVALNAQPVA